MNSITRVKYTGAALPADSDTEVLFDSTTLPGRWMEQAGLRLFSLNLVNSHSGTIKAYKSETGSTWTQVDEQALAASSFSHNPNWDIQAYPYFKVEWVNGGVTQTTFVPSMALTDETPEFTIAGLGEDLVLWLLSDESAYYALESGSANDLRRVDSLTNRGSLGGTVAQVTSANKPVLGSFPEGRCTFSDGANDTLVYDGTVTDFDFLHTGPWSVAFAVRGGSATGTTLFGTGQAVDATKKGCVFYRLSSGDNLRVAISNGSSVSIANWDNAFTGWTTTTFRVVITYDGTSATAYVNGTSLGAVSLTAAAGSTVAALTLFDTPDSTGLAPSSVFLPELIVLDRELTPTEISNVDSYLRRWTLDVAWNELVSYATLWELSAIFYSNGSAWVDRLGNYSVTEVDTPTHTTSANFNGKNILRLNGTTQYVHFDALAAEFTGSDVPFFELIALELDAPTVLNWISSLGVGATTEYHGFGTTTTPNWRIIRNDGDNKILDIGTPDTTARTIAQAFRGQTISVYDGATRLVEQSAMDQDSIAFDRATLGARRNSTLSVVQGGDFATDIWGARCLNMADQEIIRRAVAGEYGL